MTLGETYLYLLTTASLVVESERNSSILATGRLRLSISSELLRKLAGKRILKRLHLCLCMADFEALLQVGITLSGGCELAVRPTRLN